MDKLVLTDTGGFPLKLDDLLWMDGRLDSANKGIYDAIQAHLLAYGTDYIVEGCTYADPNITAGWIMLDSELMRVDAHAGTDDFFVRTVTFDARGSKTFKDTTVNNTYEKIRGVLSGASGSLDINAALRLEDKIIQLLATSTQKFAAANIPLATEALVGGLEVASTAEAQALALNTRILTPLRLADVNAGLLTKIIEIDDWDMSSATGSGTKSVAHGLSDHMKIRNIQVMIRNDADTSIKPLDSFSIAVGGVFGGVEDIDSTNIDLERLTSAFGFDNTAYDQTSYNRGWVTVYYAL